MERWRHTRRNTQPEGAHGACPRIQQHAEREENGRQRRTRRTRGGGDDEEKKKEWWARGEAGPRGEEGEVGVPSGQETIAKRAQVRSRGRGCNEEEGGEVVLL